jgi:excisionase family DNA binding protein
MDTITIYQMNERDLMSAMEKTLKNVFLSKFDNVLVTTATVADVNNVSERTIYRWIDDNKIRPTNPGSGKLLFRLSDAIREDLKYKHVG